MGVFQPKSKNQTANSLWNFWNLNPYSYRDSYNGIDRIIEAVVPIQIGNWSIPIENFAFEFSVLFTIQIPYL